MGRKVWPSSNSKWCECNEFKTSPWPKVGSICTNHLHCLACANDLIMKCLWICHFVLVLSLELLQIFFSLVYGVKKCALKFSFLLPSFHFCYLKAHLPSCGKKLGVRHQGLKEVYVLSCFQLWFLLKFNVFECRNVLCKFCVEGASVVRKHVVGKRLLGWERNSLWKKGGHLVLNFECW
jgi:hypothetical protein